MQDRAALNTLAPVAPRMMARVVQGFLGQVDLRTTVPVGLPLLDLVDHVSPDPEGLATQARVELE